MSYVTKKWPFDRLNGFFLKKNVVHPLTKNYNGTYWPLALITCLRLIWQISGHLRKVSCIKSTQDGLFINSRWVRGLKIFVQLLSGNMKFIN